MEASKRLIIGADFLPRKLGGINDVRQQVMILGKKLQGSGVIIKVNSILRACGYDLINDLHNLGLEVFADLKLIDIPNTMEMDAIMLTEFKPDFLTVMCCAGSDGIERVQKIMEGKTKILGVSVLTSFPEREYRALFNCSIRVGVLKFAKMAQSAGLEGLVLSPQEADILSKKKELTLSLNTPDIRPKWSLVTRDDQRRPMTPEKAIKAGVERIIIGRPITQANNPMEAVKRTLDEMEKAIL